MTRCTHCNRVVDKYVEVEPLLITQDMLLLRPQAYRHVLFNRYVDAALKETPSSLQVQAHSNCNSRAELAQASSVAFGRSFTWIGVRVLLVFLALEACLAWSRMVYSHPCAVVRTPTFSSPLGSTSLAIESLLVLFVPLSAPELNTIGECPLKLQTSSALTGAIPAGADNIIGGGEGKASAFVRLELLSYITIVVIALAVTGLAWSVMATWSAHLLRKRLRQLSPRIGVANNADSESTIRLSLSSRYLRRRSLHALLISSLPRILLVVSIMWTPTMLSVSARVIDALVWASHALALRVLWDATLTLCAGRMRNSSRAAAAAVDGASGGVGLSASMLVATQRPAVPATSDSRSRISSSSSSLPSVLIATTDTPDAGVTMNNGASVITIIVAGMTVRLVLTYLAISYAHVVLGPVALWLAPGYPQSMFPVAPLLNTGSSWIVFAI